MTPRSSILILAVLLLIPIVAGAQTPEQRQADAQVAAPKLDAEPITGLGLARTPLRDIVAAITKTGGITVRYHSAITNLDAVASVKLANATVADALQTVLGPQLLTFKVTGRKSVFIYPDTPANREKYTDTVRTFTIVKANVNVLMQTVNQELPPLTAGADDLRPTVVSVARTIVVRATPDTMAKIAKLIADNDK